MSRLHVVRPSLSRAFWSVVAVVATCCVIIGIASYTYLIITHSDPEPTPKGDYVRLFIVCIVYYAPMFLSIAWWATVPAMILVGVAASSVRRGTAVEHSGDDAGDLPGQPTGEPTSDIG